MALCNGLSGSEATEYSQACNLVEIAAASNFNEDTAYAFDNDMTTRWSSGQQTSDMVFALTLKETVTLNKISLYRSQESLDYPTTLRLYVSSDNQNWTPVEI